MPTVHIVQTYKHVSDVLASAFQEAGYKVETHDAADLSGVQVALALEEGPVAVVTSQMDSRTFPGNAMVGNHVAMVGKMAGVPTLTLVYSSVAPLYPDYLESTDKDKVVLVGKSTPDFDIPKLLVYVGGFFNKNTPQ